eukprot:gene16536-biopygen5911
MTEEYHARFYRGRRRRGTRPPAAPVSSPDAHERPPHPLQHALRRGVRGEWGNRGLDDAGERGEDGLQLLVRRVLRDVAAEQLVPLLAQR